MNSPILVTTCTNRKSLPVNPHLQIRQLRGKSIEKRVTDWVHRLSTATNGHRMPAHLLYAGEHWSVTKNCFPRVAGLYIVSAGYGLLASDAQISSYGATFNRGKADSVATNREDACKWWTLLNQWDGPTGKRPTLAKLAQKQVVLLAGSSPYLHAVEDEICAIDPERLLILSAGSTSRSLSDYRLDISDRLLSSLGGTSLSLNIRVADYLLTHVPPTGISRRWASKSLAALDARSTSRKRHDRQKLSDDDVNQFIAETLRRESTISNSQALRLLRDSGMACEQHRFGKLFNEQRHQHS